MPGGQFVLLPSVNTGNWIEIDVLPKMKFCWCWFDLPSHTKRFSVKIKEGKKKQITTFRCLKRNSPASEKWKIQLCRARWQIAGKNYIQEDLFDPYLLSSPEKWHIISVSGQIWPIFTSIVERRPLVAAVILTGAMEEVQVWRSHRSCNFTRTMSSSKL